MVKRQHKSDSSRRSYAQGHKHDGRDVYDLVRQYCELTVHIEQLDCELKKLLFELLELQQARNGIEALPPTHNCLDHAEETRIVHEDEDSIFEEPVVNCNVCGDDITSEFYEFIEVEPEEYNKEGDFD